eukprot:4077629-Pyramimonas_sp.AAC.1
MDIASSTRWSPMSAQITRYGYDQLNPEHINLLSSHSCKVSASLPIPACDCGFRLIFNFRCQYPGLPLQLPEPACCDLAECL